MRVHRGFPAMSHPRPAALTKTTRPMKPHLLTLIRLLAVWLLTFATGKTAFLLACSGQEHVGLSDLLQVWWHGLPMDLSTAAYLLLVPWLVLAIGLFWQGRWMHRLLMAYHALAALAVVACIIGDIALYPFWGFKLDATIFNYIDSPADALASVSGWFVAWRVLLALALAALLWAVLNRQCHSALGTHRPTARLILACALSVVLTGGALFVMLRGGLTESTMNVGNAYYSTRQFLNHSAVNPAFSLLSSSTKSERFGQLYNHLPDAEMQRTIEALGLHAEAAPTHLTPARSGMAAGSDSLPDILLIVWEGCGGQLTEAIGGHSNVVPHLDALIDEGFFFSQLRANSFRTDRGLLSILSGHISYPTHSLMKMATKAARLPSIAHTLHQAGYQNTFVYGGDINFTNMKGYLMATGYDRIVCDADFSRAERATSKWGANDSLLFERLWQVMQDGRQAPAGTAGEAGGSATAAPSRRFVTALTLSSHEPWDVPYHRLSDRKLNAFAYTDAQLGRFMQRLKQSALWANTLVIILPDHGVLAGDVSVWQDPRFFHIPMVWTGGGLSMLAAPHTASGPALAPRTHFPLLCAQSDLAATLLGCLGLPHDDFRWSRDVFSASYRRYPFTYSTFVDGFAFTDSTGTTIFDNIAMQPTADSNPQSQASRLLRGKAIQQLSYDLLEQE